MTATALGLVAFLLVAGALVEWFRRIRGVRIPRDRRGFVACWLGGAALGAIALAQGPGWVGGLPAGLATLGGLVLSGLVAISPQRVAENAIRVGESLRDFTAPDDQGEAFPIASLAGSPILLKFFRGHW